MTNGKVVRKARNKAGPPLQTVVKEPVLRHDQSLELIRTAIAATVSVFHAFLTMDNWLMIALPALRNNISPVCGVPSYHKRSLKLECPYRKVFPLSDKWNTTFYDPQDPDVNYESFISGSNELKQGQGRNWHVPVRNQRVVLDQLMFHLEHGIKDALSKKYLDKISLTFHTPGDAVLDQSNCLESYYLSVTYGQDDEPSLSTEIRDSQGVQVTTMSLREGKSKLQAMLNGVVDHFRLVPEVIKDLRMRTLPSGYPLGNIKVAIQLLYTDTAPADYQAMYFSRSAGIMVLEESDVVASEDGKYTFETDFHGLAFNYSLAPREGFTKKEQRPSAVVQSPSALAIAPSRKITRSVSKLRRNPSQFSVSDGDRTQSNILHEIQGVAHHVSRRDDSSQLDTQQYSTSPAAPFMPAKPNPVKPSGYDIPDYIEALRKNAESKLHFRAPRHDGWLHSLQDHEINCECMSRKHDGLMIECLECYRFHHAECYGYGYLSQAPRTEFCYSCIKKIFGYENIWMTSRRIDCQSRRVIRFFQNHLDRKTLAEVATHLGSDARTEHLETLTVETLGELVRYGYILHYREEQSQKVTENSEFELAVGKEEPIRHNLFDPRKGFGHLFADISTQLASNVTPVSSIERSESKDRRLSPEVPRMPRDVSRNAPILLRVGSPILASKSSTRELSATSEIPAAKDDLLKAGESNPGLELRKERSGTKRSADSSQQIRGSRRKIQ
ncbi:uncharacterized protein RCO7_00363 [Rhynchosporium graminicola]|uniref:HORMA domain-containing protein n=1 Tax=Rhynchosporium graminicola TaxID=2792576 RepID=A0A1E1KLL8_9HELO|nr:uncharacterized protein RCO7_00363 [Rhynchosporium commune]